MDILLDLLLHHQHLAVDLQQCDHHHDPNHSMVYFLSFLEMDHQYQFHHLILVQQVHRLHHHQNHQKWLHYQPKYHPYHHQVQLLLMEN